MLLNKTDIGNKYNLFISIKGIDVINTRIIVIENRRYVFLLFDFVSYSYPGFVPAPSILYLTVFIIG